MAESCLRAFQGVGTADDKDHNNNSWGFLAYSHQGRHFYPLAKELFYKQFVTRIILLFTAAQAA